MKCEHEKLVDKMVDIRNLFDDSDREAEGHGMDDLACCPVSVACYAESKIKRLMEQVGRYEKALNYYAKTEALRTPFQRQTYGMIATDALKGRVKRK